jgi:uncharacterized protein (DUF488 family)
MIFTIGYQRLAPSRLAGIVEALGAVVVDVRHKPHSARPEFSGRALAERFGNQYQQRGLELGGRGNVTAAGIERLQRDSADRAVILMCMEEAPADCHRHTAITGPHFPGAVHIFRNELFTSAALQVAIERGADYELLGEVADLFR